MHLAEQRSLLMIWLLLAIGLKSSPWIFAHADDAAAVSTEAAASAGPKIWGGDFVYPDDPLDIMNDLNPKSTDVKDGASHMNDDSGVLPNASSVSPVVGAPPDQQQVPSGPTPPAAATTAAAAASAAAGSADSTRSEVQRDFDVVRASLKGAEDADAIDRVTLSNGKEYDIVEGDILVPRLPKDVQSLSVLPYVVRWPLEKSTGKYVVPYVNRFPSSVSRIYALKSFRYLESGSNLIFRPVKWYDKRWLQFQDQGRPSRCSAEVPTMARGAVTVNLGITCRDLGVVTHEIMHALGFGHEHQRDDRHEHLTAFNTHDTWTQRTRSKNYAITPGMHHVTPYDAASLMHYTIGLHSDGAYLELFDKRLHKKLHRRSMMFLSNCDWRALNTVYPGDRGCPVCEPGKPVAVLRPSPNWVRQRWVRERCQYDPYQALQRGWCHFANRMKAPNTWYIPRARTRGQDMSATCDNTDQHRKAP